MDDFFELISSNQETGLVETLVKCNGLTKRYGLSLTVEEAHEVCVARREDLKELGRVEFGESILPKIIEGFCDSAYIYQDNYVEMLCGLQEIFYLYKNESLDEWTDEELLHYMKESFEGECQGSLEFLEETAMERLAREARKHTRLSLSREGETNE